MKKQSVKWTILVLVGLIIGFVSRTQAQFTVSGTVVNESLSPVAGVELFLYDDQGGPIGIPPTLTDASGYYSISGLPAADYGFEFVPPAPYLPILQTPVTVASNATLNVTLQVGLILSGTITDTLGNPLLDIDLNVYDQATGGKLDTPGDNSDILGFYDVAIPAGTYRLRWRAINEVMVPVEMENVVITGDTTINLSLIPGFVVDGTVQDSFGTPVFDADLDFWYTVTGLPISTPGDNTDVVGHYSVILPGGMLSANVEPLVTDGLAALDVTGILITKDTTVDFTLFPGYTIAGFVRDESSTGVSGTDIDVRDALTHVKLSTPGDLTDATGFYQMIVPAGTFDITYQPPAASGLAPVTLMQEVVSGDRVIDVIVPQGIVLSGNIQSSFGQGVLGVDIDVKLSSTGTNVPLVGDRTDISGFFQIVIEPGIYDLEVEPPPGRLLAAESLAGLALSHDTTLNVTLDTGFVIDGLITDGSGLPIPSVDIEAIEVPSGDSAFLPGGKSDVLGHYSVLIRTGVYDLAYVPDSGSGLADTVVYPSVSIGRDTTIDVSFGGTANQPPVLDSIGQKTTLINQPLQFRVTAGDPDVEPVYISASSLPATASFIDNSDGTADFSWMPTGGDIGLYNVLFSVTDGQLSDNELVNIWVTNGSGCCGIYTGGMTGNANCDVDGKRNLADITRLIDRVYISKAELCCPENGNVNGDVEGKVNLADITRLIDHVYISKTETAACL